MTTPFTFVAPHFELDDDFDDEPDDDDDFDDEDGDDEDEDDNDDEDEDVETWQVAESGRCR